MTQWSKALTMVLMFLGVLQHLQITILELQALALIVSFYLSASVSTNGPIGALRGSLPLKLRVV